MPARRRTLAWCIPAAIFAIAALLSFLAASAFEQGAREETAACRSAGNSGLHCMTVGLERKLAAEAFFWVGFVLGLLSLGLPFLGRWYDRRARRPAVPVLRSS